MQSLSTRQRGFPRVSLLRLYFSEGHTGWGGAGAPSAPHRAQAHKLVASPKAFCFFRPGMAASSTAGVSSEGSAKPSDR